MTDRAQPGAIDSIIRNDELAQILGQLTGGFDDGWVADPADPTAASTRRTDIDESAFDGFALSNVSSSSLSVDVGPGEAFAAGWLAIDTTTNVTLPANTTSTIVAAMDLNAIYDPQNDPDRDAADKVVIDLAANVSDDLPRVRLHEATTDGSGVTATTDLRKPYGPALEAASGTVGSLEATGSFTDPSGIEYSGAINPVQVTEEASTFNESDVTVSQTNTSISNGFINLSADIIDDFESGDLTVENPNWGSWDLSGGVFQAQQSTIISGNYTGELLTQSSDRNIAVDITRDSTTTQKIKIKVQISDDVGNTADSCDIVFAVLNSYSQAGTLSFEDGSGDLKWIGSSTTKLQDWFAGQTYTLELDWDFNNDNVDIIIDGSNKGTFSLENSLNGFEYVSFKNDSNSADVNRSFFFDDVMLGDEPTSGNALVEWDSGVPEDLDSYDLATFQRTLDGETVTIDVEDANGNVLFSDISQNFDISTVNTSKNVKLRANLSRNDTSNNPTVDYLARRFNRS